jgi:hypothetical protein
MLRAVTLTTLVFELDLGNLPSVVIAAGIIYIL